MDNKKNYVRKRVSFYSDYLYTLQKMDKNDVADIFLSLAAKAENQPVQTFRNDSARLFFDIISSDYDRACQIVEERKKSLSENGKKGAAAKWAKRKAQPSQPDIPFVEAEEVERYPFEEFWELYEKKTHTMECKNLWRRISDEDKAQIMAHVPQYVAATPEKRYRRDPYNYLSKRGWEDEIITPQSNGNNNIQPNNRVSQRELNIAIAGQALAEAYANVRPREPFDTPTE